MIYFLQFTLFMRPHMTCSHEYSRACMFVIMCNRKIIEIATIIYFNTFSSLSDDANICFAKYYNFHANAVEHRAMNWNVSGKIFSLVNKYCIILCFSSIKIHFGAWFIFLLIQNHSENNANILFLWEILQRENFTIFKFKID